jgi:hypothetical protein
MAVLWLGGRCGWVAVAVGACLGAGGSGKGWVAVDGWQCGSMQLETAVILVLISLCMVVYWRRYGSGSIG